MVPCSTRVLKDEPTFPVATKNDPALLPVLKEDEIVKGDVTDFNMLGNLVAKLL